MANFTGDCRNDLDCSELQFCYRNVSWAPDRIFCDCNSFWVRWTPDYRLKLSYTCSHLYASRDGRVTTAYRLVSTPTS